MKSLGFFGKVEYLWVVVKSIDWERMDVCFEISFEWRRNFCWIKVVL